MGNTPENPAIIIRDHHKSFMKKVLDLGRSQFSSTEEFNSFRSVVVDLAYGELDKIFSDLTEIDFLKPCTCKKGMSNRKDGFYNEACQCNGVGFVPVK